MVQLNYKKAGEGRPLIVLHGLFGSLDNWATLSRKWMDRYTVYLVDLRNHGKSPHTDTHSIDDMVGDLVKFIDDHEIQNPVVLGHSMGGKVAMELALSRPELLSGVIVVDIGPQAYGRGHDYIFEGVNALNMDEVSSRKEIEETLSQSIPNRAEVLFMSKNVDRTQSGFKWKINVDVLEKDYENIIVPIAPGRTFDGPALFLSGERSDYLQPHQHDLIRELFPRVEIVTIPNAGHWIHAENPEDFDEQVRQFMDNL